MGNRPSSSSSDIVNGSSGMRRAAFEPAAAAIEHLIAALLHAIAHRNFAPARLSPRPRLISAMSQYAILAVFSRSRTSFWRCLHSFGLIDEHVTIESFDLTSVRGQVSLYVIGACNDVSDHALRVLICSESRLVFG